MAFARSSVFLIASITILQRKPGDRHRKITHLRILPPPVTGAARNPSRAVGLIPMVADSISAGAWKKRSAYVSSSRATFKKTSGHVVGRPRNRQHRVLPFLVSCPFSNSIGNQSVCANTERVSSPAFKLRRYNDPKSHTGTLKYYSAPEKPRPSTIAAFNDSGTFAYIALHTFKCRSSLRRLSTER